MRLAYSGRAATTPCDSQGPAHTWTSGEKIEGSNRAIVTTNPDTWRSSVEACGCRDCLSVRHLRDFVIVSVFQLFRQIIHVIRRIDHRPSSPSASHVGDLQEFDERHRQIRAREAATSMETSSWLVERSIIASGGTCRERVCIACGRACVIRDWLWEKWEVHRTWRDFLD